MAYNILDWPDSDPTVSVPVTRKVNNLRDVADAYGYFDEPNVDDITWNTMDVALMALQDAKDAATPTGNMAKTQQLRNVDIYGTGSSRPAMKTYPIQTTKPNLKTKDVRPMGHPVTEFDFEDFFPDDVGEIGDLDLTGDKQPKAKKYKVPKDKSDRDRSGFDGGLTLGDKIGMIGTTVGMLGKTASTIINRLGDRPNENRFLDYAKDTLNTLYGSKVYAQKMLDYAGQEIDMTEATAKRQSMQYARGINELRAMQLGSHMQTQTARRQARNQYAATMLGIDKNIADVQLRRDQVVMGANERVDDKNKADRDAFFTNLSRDFADWGMYGQQLGRNLNQSQLNRMELNLLNQQSKYGLRYDKDGNLIESPSSPSATAPAITPVAQNNTPVTTAQNSSAYNPTLDLDYDFDYTNAFGYKKGNALSASSYYYDPIDGTLKRR